MKDCTGLVEQYLKGDRDVLDRVVEAIQGDIFHLMLSELRNTADAEDATQETFRQVVTSLHSLRDPRTFAGWVYRIALDKARQVRRSGAVRAKTVREAAGRASTFTGEEAMRAAEMAETRGKVEEAVAGLEENLRAIVRLRYEHDLTYAEIAEAMEVPAGTVAQRLSAAHSRLRQALAGVGVVLALAALEGELRAAERHPLPEGLGEALRRISRAKEAAGGLRTAHRSKGKRAWVAAAVALLAVLGILSWRFGLTRNDDRGSQGRFVAASNQSTSGESGARTAPPTTTPAKDGEKTPEKTPVDAAVPAGFSGRLLNRATGAPILGATVWLQTETDSSHRFATATTDENGKFSFSVSPGEYAIGVQAAGYVGPQIEYDMIEAEWMETELGQGKNGPPKNPLAARPDHVTLMAGENPAVDLPLAPGVAIHGTVVDTAGRPLVGAGVKFSQLSPKDVPVEDLFYDTDDFGLGTIEEGQKRRQLVTDDHGRFELPGLLMNAKVTISVTCEGFLGEQLGVELADRPVDAVVTMKPGCQFEGVVVDSKGAPVAGASVHFSDPDRSPDEDGTTYLPGHDPGTDAQGRFRYSDVPSGAKLACAIAPGHGYTIVDISGQNPTQLKIVLPDSDQSISGVVRDEAGKPVANATVCVYDLMFVEGPIRAHMLFMENTMGKRPFEKGDIALGFAPPGYASPRVKTSKTGEFKLEGVPLSPAHPLILLISERHYYDGRLRVETGGWVEAVLKEGR